MSKQCKIAINAANTIPLFDTCCITTDTNTTANDITIARIEPTSVLLPTDHELSRAVSLIPHSNSPQGSILVSSQRVPIQTTITRSTLTQAKQTTNGSCVTIDTSNIHHEFKRHDGARTIIATIVNIPQNCNQKRGRSSKSTKKLQDKDDCIQGIIEFCLQNKKLLLRQQADNEYNTFWIVVT